MAEEKIDFNPERERVFGIKIPDSDVAGWMKELHDADMTAEQIDDFFIRLNDTYRREKEIIPSVQKEIDRISQEFEARGETLTEENKERYRDLLMWLFEQKYQQR